MEEKDDKGKGDKEEQKVEDTTSQNMEIQDKHEQRKSAENYDLKESKGIWVFWFTVCW